MIESLRAFCIFCSLTFLINERGILGGKSSFKCMPFHRNITQPRTDVIIKKKKKRDKLSQVRPGRNKSLTRLNLWFQVPRLKFPLIRKNHLNQSTCDFNEVMTLARASGKTSCWVMTWTCKRLGWQHPNLTNSTSLPFDPTWPFLCDPTNYSLACVYRYWMIDQGVEICGFPV